MTSTVFIKTVKKEMRIYKRDKNIYNIICFTEMGKTAMRLSKEQAEKILENNLKHIKRTIKKKIAIYEPLEFNTIYTKFIQWVQEEDFKVIRELPENCRDEEHLDELVKNFLIENAYYALEEYIQRIIMNKFGILNPNEIRVLEAVDFVRERLEKEELKKLKKFKEKSKFKTFITTVVNRLFIDCWREQNEIEENVTKHGSEFDALFDPPVEDPLIRLIKLEDEAFKNKAVELLPRILDKLDYNEKVAIKLKYEKGMKTSEIARTLDQTRYKTGQFIEQIEKIISRKILSVIKKGGNNETSGR
jgi:RNA polymerase sigma factor (sigma-70 family)